MAQTSSRLCLSLGVELFQGLQKDMENLHTRRTLGPSNFEKVSFHYCNNAQPSYLTLSGDVSIFCNA